MLGVQVNILSQKKSISRSKNVFINWKMLYKIVAIVEKKGRGM